MGAEALSSRARGQASLARTSPEGLGAVLLPVVGAKDLEGRGRCFGALGGTSQS